MTLTTTYMTGPSIVPNEIRRIRVLAGEGSAKRFKRIGWIIYSGSEVYSERGLENLGGPGGIVWVFGVSTVA